MREDVKNFVTFICGENWEEASDEDRRGGYGVACMQAYINGIKPTVDEFVKFLEIPIEDVKAPFAQLLQSGLFSKAFNARGDTSLNIKLDVKKGKDKEDYLRDIKCAWGHIAAISSGTIVRNYSNMDIKPI